MFKKSIHIYITCVVLSLLFCFFYIFVFGKSAGSIGLRRANPLSKLFSRGVGDDSPGTKELSLPSTSDASDGVSQSTESAFLAYVEGTDEYARVPSPIEEKSFFEGRNESLHDYVGEEDRTVSSRAITYTNVVVVGLDPAAPSITLAFPGGYERAFTVGAQGNAYFVEILGPTKSNHFTSIEAAGISLHDSVSVAELTKIADLRRVGRKFSIILDRRIEGSNAK
jgi:hypothetical protein